MQLLLLFLFIFFLFQLKFNATRCLSVQCNSYILETLLCTHCAHFRCIERRVECYSHAYIRRQNVPLRFRIDGVNRERKKLTLTVCARKHWKLVTRCGRRETFSLRENIESEMRYNIEVFETSWREPLLLLRVYVCCARGTTRTTALQPHRRHCNTEWVAAKPL